MRQAIESIMKNTLTDSYLFMAEDMARPIACRERAHLWQQRYNNMFTYYTPNTYYRSDKNRCKDNLRWLNCFFLDIDNPQATAQDVFDACETAGLPMPSFINKSPHGLHPYFIFDEPLPATPANIRLYDEIVLHISKELSGDAKGAERFIRIPKNIIFQGGQTYSFNFFKDWHELNNDKPEHRPNVGFLPKGWLADKGVKIILQGVEKGKRDNSALTLALVFYAEGYSKESALEHLIEWNRRNPEPMPEHVLSVKVKSAYSGKYRGPAAEWVAYLSGVDCKYRPITKAKPREERKYLHLHEHQQDIIDYLRLAGGVVTASQRALAKTLGIAVASLVRAIRGLEEKGKLNIVVKGVGRGAQTTYSLVESSPITIDAVRNSKNLQKVMYSIGIHSRGFGRDPSPLVANTS